MNKVKWDEIKNIFDAEIVTLTHLDLSDMCIIHCRYADFHLECALLKDGNYISELAEFNADYLQYSNQKLLDGSGIPYSHFAIIEKGKSYLAHFLQVYTCDLTKGIYCEDHNGTRETQNYAKFYDVNNTELVTQATIDSSCVKSVFTIKPEIDYSIVKGEVAHSVTPLVDVRMHTVIGLIDPNGNQLSVVPFIRNINLKFLHPARDIETDGKAPKKLNQVVVGAPYDANQVQVVVYHPAGYKHDVQISMEYYR